MVLRYFIATAISLLLFQFLQVTEAANIGLSKIEENDPEFVEEPRANAGQLGETRRIIEGKEPGGPVEETQNQPKEEEVKKETEAGNKDVKEGAKTTPAVEDGKKVAAGNGAGNGAVNKAGNGAGDKKEDADKSKTANPQNGSKQTAKTTEQAKATPQDHSKTDHDDEKNFIMKFFSMIGHWFANLLSGIKSLLGLD